MKLFHLKRWTICSALCAMLLWGLIACDNSSSSDSSTVDDDDTQCDPIVPLTYYVLFNACFESDLESITLTRDEDCTVGVSTNPPGVFEGIEAVFTGDISSFEGVVNGLPVQCSGNVGGETVNLNCTTDGQQCDIETTTIQPSPNDDDDDQPNRPPTADVTYDPGLKFHVSELLTLDASGSSDPDGDPLTFTWEVTQRPEGSTNEPGIAGVARTVSQAAVNGAIITFQPDVPGQYTIVLTVSDGNGGTSTVDSSFFADNAGPVGNAGSTGSFGIGSQLLFTGNPTDEDEDPLTCTWELLERPAASTAEPQPGADECTAGFVPDVKGFYLLRLTITDGWDTWVHDFEFIVPNTPPSCSLECEPVEVPRFDPTSVSCSATAQDIDGDPLSYAWSAVGADPETAAGADAAFTITASENENSFNIEVEVNDGDEGSCTASTTIVVGDAPPAPVAEYGDAPDSTLGNLDTGYGNGRPGRFPTLYYTANSSPAGTPGVHHLDATREWLGDITKVDLPNIDTQALPAEATPQASVEAGAADPADPDGSPNLTDRDEFDQGLEPRALLTCEPTTLRVRVSVADRNSGRYQAEDPERTLYLNLLVDFDHSGNWGGRETGCGVEGEAPEWAVRNLPLNPDSWATDSRLVELGPFPVGSQAGKTFARLTLSYGQPVEGEDWDGSGEFDAGETEDYALQLTIPDNPCSQDETGPTLQNIRVSLDEGTEPPTYHIRGQIVDENQRSETVTMFTTGPENHPAGLTLLDPLTPVFQVGQFGGLATFESRVQVEDITAQPAPVVTLIAVDGCGNRTTEAVELAPPNDAPTADFVGRWVLASDVGGIFLPPLFKQNKLIQQPGLQPFEPYYCTDFPQMDNCGLGIYDGYFSLAIFVDMSVDPNEDPLTRTWNFTGGNTLDSTTVDCIANHIGIDIDAAALYPTGFGLGKFVQQGGQVLPFCGGLLYPVSLTVTDPYGLSDSKSGNLPQVCEYDCADYYFGQ